MGNWELKIKLKIGKQGMVKHACKSSSWEVEAEGLGHKETSLHYKKPCLKNQKQLLEAIQFHHENESTKVTQKLR